jgi:hypothetical protein
MKEEDLIQAIEKYTKEYPNTFGIYDIKKIYEKVYIINNTKIDLNIK